MGITARTPSGGYTQVQASETGRLLVETANPSTATGGASPRVQGPLAFGDSASAAAPFVMAGRAATSDLLGAAGTVMYASMTANGAQISKPYALPQLDWSYTSGVTPLTASAAVVKAAAGAALKNYVTAVQLSNTGATTVVVTLLRGATVIWAGVLAAGAQFSYTLPTPLASAVNEAINVQANTASAIYANVQGYVGA